MFDYLSKPMVQMHSYTNNSESRKRIIPNHNKSISLLYLKVKRDKFWRLYFKLYILLDI